jgi:hypothetical protein
MARLSFVIEPTWRSSVKVGDLVRTPKVSTYDAEYAMKAGLGLGYYDWEGKLAIVVGFDTVSKGRDSAGVPFIEVRIQDTGKLCIFSPSVLTRVK